MGGSLWWAWRGSVWRWGGRAFGALGGAVSPDKQLHDLRHYRWPEEATTEDDLERLVANADTEFDGWLDVLFSHDAPAQVQGLKQGANLRRLEQVSIYRGLPGGSKNPIGYGATRK